MSRDVHRALELLEEYHADLIRPSDHELKYAIERVVNSFKTGLFNALCDIQEFYDNTLLNSAITFSQKAAEARRFADRWDGTNAPFSANPLPFSRPSSAFSGVRFGPTETFGTGNVLNYSSVKDYPQAPPSRLIEPTNVEFDVFEVTVDARSAGLGFSISGGSDRPPQPDQHIRVTEIKEQGAVYLDGRIRTGDVILKVNNVDVSHVPHERAVQALTNSGQLVKLLLKRERPSRSLSHTHLTDIPPSVQPDFKPVHRSRSLHQLPPPNPIPVQRPISRQSYGNPYAPPASADVGPPRALTLRKGNHGLQFNIVGGESGEPIYISHVTPGGVADLSGQVKKGDVLLRVNDIDLQGADHSQAAAALKSIPPNSNVTLVLQFRPRESSQFFDKLQRASQGNLSQYR